MSNSNTQIIKLGHPAGEQLFSLAIRDSPLGAEKSVVIKGHTFRKRTLKRAARNHAYAFMLAHSAGRGQQAQRHLEEVHNVVLTDQAYEVVRLANRVGLFAKVFAVSDSATRSIESRMHDWRLEETSLDNESIPPRLLGRLDRLTMTGVNFDGFALAKPYNVMPSTPLFATVGRAVASLLRDPVLLGYKVGKNGYRAYVEIARWT